jgi:hypothetical protein
MVDVKTNQHTSPSNMPILRIISFTVPQPLTPIRTWRLSWDAKRPQEAEVTRRIGPLEYYFKKRSVTNPQRAGLQNYQSVLVEDCCKTMNDVCCVQSKNTPATALVLVECKKHPFGPKKKKSRKYLHNRWVVYPKASWFYFLPVTSASGELS